jgi:hypothetical protein
MQIRERIVPAGAPVGHSLGVVPRVDQLATNTATGSFVRIATIAAGAPLRAKQFSIRNGVVSAVVATIADREVSLRLFGRIGRFACGA